MRGCDVQIFVTALILFSAEILCCEIGVLNHCAHCTVKDEDAFFELFSDSWHGCLAPFLSDGCKLSVLLLNLIEGKG